MKDFFKNCKKYWNFCCYSAYCQLNREVAGMKLGWVWWLLEPALFMCVYAFVFSMVFASKMTYMMAYISSGVMLWGFFNRMILGSVSIVKTYSGLLKRVYMPKYVLIVSRMMLSAFKMAIAFLIVIFFLFYYQIPFSLTMLQFIPVLAVYFLFTFGVSLWIMHWGVYLRDLKKIISVLMRVLFYFCGVVYNLNTRLGTGVGKIMLTVNPVARLMHEARNVLLYGKNCSVKHLLLWFVVGIIITITGIQKVTRYERDYLKVI